jgi:hypothetical protein
MSNLILKEGYIAILISISSLVGLISIHTTNNNAQADTGKIHYVSIVGACRDGLDNDADGWTDFDDLGDCQQEQLPPILPAEHCSDGIDNDGDFFIDHEDVNSCPRIPNGLPEICDDGIDNDGDGFADRWDLGDCFRGPVVIAPPEYCFDGLDNDGDGFINEEPCIS